MTGPATSYRQVLGLPSVPELLLTAGWARLAGRMFTLAVVFYALQRFDSPQLAGWIAFTSMLPGMIVSPIAGALLDRFGAARIILIDLVASAGLLAALVGLDAARSATPAVVLILVGLYSLTSPLSSAGIRTLIPRLVPVPARDRANALDTSINALVGVVGWLIVANLFRLYVDHIGSYNRVYGSLGVVVIFLVFLYLTGLTVLIGGETSAELQDRRAADRARDPVPPAFP